MTKERNTEHYETYLKVKLMVTIEKTLKVLVY